MSSVKYSFDGDTWIEGTILEWALQLQIFFNNRLFPPYVVAKNYALTGEANHGMTAYLLWKPFELTASDYEAIKRSFFDVENTILQEARPDDAVQTLDDWHLWRYEKLYRVPKAEHRPLHLAFEKSRVELERELTSGEDARKIDELTEIKEKARSALLEFLDLYMPGRLK